MHRTKRPARLSLSRTSIRPLTDAETRRVGGGDWGAPDYGGGGGGGGVENSPAIGVSACMFITRTCCTV